MFDILAYFEDMFFYKVLDGKNPFIAAHGEYTCILEFCISIKGQRYFHCVFIYLSFVANSLRYCLYHF